MVLDIADILFTVHLAIGRRGYLIQSDVLHIPDRFGFFSPGPPGLQALQGADFAMTAFYYGFLFICGAFRPLLRTYQRPLFAILAVGHGILFILGAVFVLCYKLWGFPNAGLVALLCMAISLGDLHGLWAATKGQRQAA
jgi:hypothetical protein